MFGILSGLLLAVIVFQGSVENSDAPSGFSNTNFALFCFFNYIPDTITIKYGYSTRPRQPENNTFSSVA